MNDQAKNETVRDMMESNTHDLSNQVMCIPDQAKKILVQNTEQYQRATDYLKTIKEMKKKVEETFNPICKKAQEAHKEAVKRRDQHLNPLVDSKRIVEQKMNFYIAEERKKEQEEQRRLEEIERQKRIAEQKRLAEEQQKREEEALKQAAELEASGDKEAANQVLEEVQEETLIDEMPESAPVQAESSIPKMKGVHTRKTWEFEIKDPSKINPQYMIPDMVKIRKQVRATGEDAAQFVGGIKVWCKESVQTRS